MTLARHEIPADAFVRAWYAALDAGKTAKELARELGYSHVDHLNKRARRMRASRTPDGEPPLELPPLKPSPRPQRDFYEKGRAVVKELKS